MITVATLVRDTPDMFDLIDVIDHNMPCEYEIVIGDNSTDPSYSEGIKEIADEYIKISDKQLFRMGLPWAHNLINSISNTYKIFYLDSDEYPVWIHPEIEDRFDINYIIPALRFDFFPKEDIMAIDKNKQDYQSLINYCSGYTTGVSIQDRIYNSRYVQFDGLCHSSFHAPLHFRSAEAGAIYLHNKTVREAKDKDRMDDLIDEQFARQNINFMLAASEQVLGWGKGMTHKFEDWNEWNDYYKLSGA